MKRQALDDGTWFDVDAAEQFTEAKRWDGHNHVSQATDSQWHHEALYRTAGGAWILNHWSDYQGSSETWARLADDEAARWLVRNEHDEHEACATAYAALEVK